MAAWLRKAELEGRKQQCAPYSEEAFSKALERLKKATTLPVTEWAATIRKECNACGVAYVILPELPGTHASGAAREINDDCYLIVQTGRYKDDGHFWFTFFHEARHVLQGKLKRQWLVEYEGREDPLETDANTFAREFLIPTEEIAKMRARNGGKMPVKSGRELAEKLGIAPGIVSVTASAVRRWLTLVGRVRPQAAGRFGGPWPRPRAEHP